MIYNLTYMNKQIKQNIEFKLNGNNDSSSNVNNNKKKNSMLNLLPSPIINNNTNNNKPNTNTNPNTNNSNTIYTPISTGFQSLDDLLTNTVNNTNTNTNNTSNTSNSMKKGLSPGSVVELLSSTSNAGKSYLCMHIACAAAIATVMKNNELEGYECENGYSGNSGNSNGNGNSGNNDSNVNTNTNTHTNTHTKRTYNKSKKSYILYIDTGNTITDGANLLTILQNIVTTNSNTNNSQYNTQSQTQIKSFVESCLSIIDIQKCNSLQELITVLTNAHTGISNSGDDSNDIGGSGSSDGDKYTTNNTKHNKQIDCTLC